MKSSRVRRPQRIVVPTRNDPLLRRFTELIGGPLGRHSSPGRVDPGFFTVERVLVILTTIAALVSVLVKNPCRVNGWSTPQHFYMACYSDWPELFQSRGLADGVFPFLTEGAQFEYPVLLGLLAGATALLVPSAGSDQARALAYFDINAGLVAAVWIVTVIATARMTNRRPWDAAMVAVAPGIVLAGTINWDLWAVMLATLGMLFFARNRPVAAGVFIGLGTALKLYPLLILGAVLVLAIRSGKFRPLVLSTGAAAATWLVVNVPFMIKDFGGWRYFLTFTQDRGAGYSSVWFAYNEVAERLGWSAVGAEFINFWAFTLFAAACAGIAVLGLTVARRPRMAQLVFLIVAAFILTNKVYSPQFVLWLVPLVALARPRWTSFLVWQLMEALHWWAIWMFLAKETSGGSSQNNLDSPYYVLAVVAHILATAYIMWRVVGDMFEPEYDVVRAVGADDPQGGPFDQAPDRWLLPWSNGTAIEQAASPEQRSHIPDDVPTKAVP